MKRSGFKRKATKQMKRTRLKKKSKSPQKKLEDKLWEECRRITFEQYGRDCYTCPQKGLTGRNLHCGHMWAKGSVGALLKYEIRILRPQCYNCNMNLGGMGAVFIKRMEKEEGKIYMKKLNEIKTEDKKGLVKATDWYTQLLAEYKLIKK